MRCSTTVHSLVILAAAEAIKLYYNLALNTLYVPITSQPMESERVFAKESSEGVVDNVVINHEDSTRSIAPTTVPEARNKSQLEGRQFFHSRTFQPMSSEYLFGNEDSEDEVDHEIADLEDKIRLDRFVDVKQHEKRLMLLWNSFVRRQRVVADGHIPWACEAFTTKHREDFLQSPELHKVWTLFMIKLWNHGLLDAKTMDNCACILSRHDAEKKN